MANNITGSGKKPLTKEQMQALAKRRKAKERRAMLTERRQAAISNSRERDRYLSGYGDDDYDYTPQTSGPVASGGVPEVDHRFAADIQKMKFCRKPVGFLMTIIFLVALALVALSFIPVEIPMVDQYTAIFAETEAKAQTPADNQDENNENTEDENGGEETPANAESGENTDETGDGETADGEETGDESGETVSEATGTYYKFSDPVYGWISYIAKLFNYDLTIGDSAWYDTQISKVETGMSDNLAAILIQAFPAAIILYVIFALTLVIKTFICWASGDRRIYRHTSIECLIMIILALIVAIGGYACTVDINAKMEFGNIVNYLIGIVTGTGGFTAGYGLLIMVALPLVGLILSFFLLEKKLRSREITQPIIMYEYRESLRDARARSGRG